LESAALLTLQDIDRRSVLGFWTQLMASGTVREKIALLRLWASSSPHRIASFNGVKNQLETRWYFYPKWLWNRVRTKASGLLNASVLRELHRSHAVEAWLHP
jgi:hypothetical protein